MLMHVRIIHNSYTHTHSYEDEIGKNLTNEWMDEWLKEHREIVCL